ncbi:hypothetical protein EMIHUDRAFT_199468 [Emiliania huxleyi CCMP1516]|uniref:Uncharacterized protein n=2 Tax=Emiliania huxleyi TaxID=2903 RepID=A0A0D3J231_EMIH1|nr:hypothetical protein EMIHUDRAFT_244019 [Emiliania huxleyi CCMP1516]XP_005793648.1 hypothetical protein EMIHUDRAFT_199468 [Emiliania huxleyi CCMP1516]EOD17566.1 hypothetical protein EMIHUDRAFT_244019 [Emiliania huxleyi CCMP1516]EOD41219.1 hypothetical protein EMIHUDRAFT_199468 [Emiliania huxleyi CCMP1516]|eukprot:XP_005769995.1 hypothetical protein EMIHUDRAFT_244019 [Emiliania huxleyi CCMP1516]
MPMALACATLLSIGFVGPQGPIRRTAVVGPRARSARCCDAGDEPAESALKSLFTTNRDSPDARANQLAWARRQMEAEVPQTTLDGAPIAGRDDLIRKYIAAEKEKLGRELEWEEAAGEVDAWLLKQATAAPAKTSAADVGAALAVFAAAFALQLYFSSR